MTLSDRASGGAASLGPMPTVDPLRSNVKGRWPLSFRSSGHQPCAWLVLWHVGALGR